MNKTTIMSVVVVVVLVIGGWYFYTTMHTDSDVKSEMQSVIKSDATKDQSTNPDDISSSVDNVNMAELDAQIKADMESF